MKKIYLTFCVLSSFCAINTYAAVSMDTQTTCACPPGCYLPDDAGTRMDQNGGGMATGVTNCYCLDKNTKEPCDHDLTISQTPAEPQATAKDSPKKQKRLRNRSATTVQVPQKVIYKEIYFDDSVDEIEE